MLFYLHTKKIPAHNVARMVIWKKKSMSISKLFV